MNTIDYIYNDLRKILESVVVKYDSKAKDGESVESRRDSDRYINAMNQTDNFRSYSKFSKDAIRNCGIFNEETVEIYHADKYKIPEYLRNRVVTEERFLIIENYVERNNYYRELIGLPDLDDDDFVYLPLELCNKHNVSFGVPIHEYGDDQIYKLERTVLPSLIEQYPDKGYLKYLGSNKVDLIKARQANNFEIINCSMTQETVFLNTFFDAYMSCREYFTSVIYVKEFSKMYDLYDNFIAMNIMLMCIQRVMVNTLKIGIDRDFYDLHSIQSLFNSYGLPFFEALPINYQRSIMKNLNMLLRYKSTDKVLYDISTILYFDRIQIFKYFLMKERKFDKHGNPLFLYKEIENENGEKEIVEDIEKMYSFHFQSTDVLERNTALALENDQTKLSFEEVTENDPFWWNDEDVQKLLYEQEFNYVETKYLGVNVMYRITETLFESVYALNMLADKKFSSTDSLFISLEKITNEKVSVFDAVIALFALTSKKCGMKGNIIHQPSQVLSVLGFDFKANFDEIIEQVKANPHIPSEIVKYLINIDITSAQDINDMYYNLRWLGDFLTERMTSTKSIKEYRACSDLYKTLMIKEYTTDILVKQNGEVASTYLDYLYDKNVKLAEFVNSCSKDNTDVYIRHILGKINELIPQLEHMSTIEGSDNIMIDALLKLIEFFKSYTVDLDSLNVLYVMDNKYYNMIRMIHDINLIDKVIQKNENSFREYFDNIATHVKLDGKDQLTYLHKCFIEKAALFKYLHEVFDKEYIDKTLGLTSIPTLKGDDFERVSKIIESFDETYLDSMQEYHININMKNKYTMKEIIRELLVNIFIKDSSAMNLYNDVLTIQCKDNYVYKINIDEFVVFFGKLYIDEYLTTEHKYNLTSVVYGNEYIMEDYIDLMSASATFESEAKVNLRDMGKKYVSISRADNLSKKLKTKLLDFKTIAEYRSLIESTNIINIFANISNKYDISPEEWSHIHNEFKVIEKGYKGVDYWYNSTIRINTRILEDYLDIINIIKTLSLSLNIKASDLCSIYISLSREDNLTLKNKYKYYSLYNIKNMIAQKTKKHLTKLSHNTIKINVKDLYRIYRSIHRNDRCESTDKINLKSSTTINSKIMNKYPFISSSSANLRLKSRENITDIMEVILTHNLKSLLRLENEIRQEKNMNVSMLLLDVFNGYLCNMISYINIPRQNIPIKDKTFDTIIRHNFTELQKIKFKIEDFKSDVSALEIVFKSYYEIVNIAQKILNSNTDINITCEAACEHVEIAINEFLDELIDVLNSVSANIQFKESELESIKEIVHLFGNIYYNDRSKIVSKLQMIHSVIEIRYLLFKKIKLQELSSIMYVNNNIDLLLFDISMIQNIITVAEKFNMTNAIVSQYKDFYYKFYIMGKDKYSINDILEYNSTLSILYSDFIYMNNESICRDKTNMEDRIKVFYE